MPYTLTLKTCMEDNLIVVAAYPVKYHDIEYNDDYITVTQNMTRRRVPKIFSKQGFEARKCYTEWDWRSSLHIDSIFIVVK